MNALALYLLLLLPMVTSFVFGYHVGHERGEAKAYRYHVDNKLDIERAHRLFDSRWVNQPDGSRTGPAVHDDALQLLKDDPDEYFRLSKIYQGLM